MNYLRHDGYRYRNVVKAKDGDIFSLGSLCKKDIIQKKMSVFLSSSALMLGIRINFLVNEKNKCMAGV